MARSTKDSPRALRRRARSARAVPVALFVTRIGNAIVLDCPFCHKSHFHATSEATTHTDCFAVCCDRRYCLVPATPEQVYAAFATSSPKRSPRCPTGWVTRDAIAEPLRVPGVLFYRQSDVGMLHITYDGRYYHLFVDGVLSDPSAPNRQFREELMWARAVENTQRTARGDSLERWPRAGRDGRLR